MSNYENKLVDEGFPINRAMRLDAAINALHMAICELDLSNTKRFFTKSLEQRLKEFAKCEELRDVTEVQL